MTIVTLSILILRVGSFKPDLSAMLPSSARPLKSPFCSKHFRINYLQASSDGAIDALSPYYFRPDYCKVQANAAADALPCRPLRKTFGLSRFRASLSRFRVSLSRFRSSLSYFRASRFRTLRLRVTLRTLLFWASSCRLSTLLRLHQILVCGTFVLS